MDITVLSLLLRLREHRGLLLFNLGLPLLLFKSVDSSFHILSIMTDETLNRPSRGITKSTDCVTLDLVTKLLTR